MKRATKFFLALPVALVTVLWIGPGLASDEAPRNGRGSLRVFVHASNGEPRSDAEVRLESTDPIAMVTSTRTDATGIAWFHGLASGTVRVTVGETRDTQTARISADSTTPIDFLLP